MSLLQRLFSKVNHPSRGASSMRVTRRKLHVEPLEQRLLLAVDLAVADGGNEVLLHDSIRIATPMIVAGDPNGSPADSPSNRVDANTTASDFAGVGSLFMKLGRFNGYVCTATPIDASHLTNSPRSRKSI